MGTVKKFHDSMPIVCAKYHFDLSNAKVTQDKVFHATNREFQGLEM